MAGLLSNFRNTIILSVILALVMVGGYAAHAPGEMVVRGSMGASPWRRLPAETSTAPHPVKPRADIP